MTDTEMVSVIRQKYPEMSNEAAKRMVFDWRWEAMPGKGRSPVPMPKNDTGALARVQKTLEKVEADLKKYLPRGSKTTAIESLNESADEAAWEARVS